MLFAGASRVCRVVLDHYCETYGKAQHSGQESRDNRDSGLHDCSLFGQDWYVDRGTDGKIALHYAMAFPDRGLCMTSRFKTSPS
jgi:hypothetical protein